MREQLSENSIQKKKNREEKQAGAHLDLSRDIVNLNWGNKTGSLKKINNLTQEIESIKRNEYSEIEDTCDKEAIDKCYEKIINAIKKILPKGYYIREAKDVDGLYWRGSGPAEILSLLTDSSNALRLESDKPNIATRWSASIAYSGERKNIIDQNTPFNIAIGFNGDGLDIDNPRDSHTGDAPFFRIANGDLEADSVKAIAIRLQGNKPGSPLPPKLYQLYQEEAERVAA